MKPIFLLWVAWRPLFWIPQNLSTGCKQIISNSTWESWSSMEHGRCLSLNTAMTARSILLTRQVLPLGHHLRRAMPVKVLNFIFCTLRQCLSAVCVCALNLKCAKVYCKLDLGEMMLLRVCLFACLCQSFCSSTRDEVRLAKEASKKYGKPEPTIFSKIIDKTIPAAIIYEDDKVSYRLQIFTNFD